MRGTTSSSPAQISWVLTRYIIAMAVATLLGGWLTDNFLWHWVILINLPLGNLSFLGALKYLPAKAKENPRLFHRNPPRGRDFCTLPVPVSRPLRDS